MLHGHEEREREKNEAFRAFRYLAEYSTGKYHSEEKKKKREERA